MASLEPFFNTSIPGWGRQPVNSVPSPGLFEHFFPAWEVGLHSILDEQCKAYYQLYKETTARNNAYGVVECILQQFPQFRQLEMNISSVVLGLTPTFLQAVGVSPVELSLLHIHRPFLAFVLSIGSPAVIPMRSEGFGTTINEKLKKTAPQPGSTGTSQYRSLSLDLLTMVFAIGAVGNTWYLAYQLGYWSISVFSVGVAWLPMFWHSLTILFYLVGIWALRLTLSISRPQSTTSKLNATSTLAKPKGKSGLITSILHRIEDMLEAVKQEPPINIQFHTNPSVKRQFLFKFLDWLLLIGITGYTAFGSVLLASLIFISVADSFSVLFRYLASAIVCRLVLSFELSRREVQETCP